MAEALAVIGIAANIVQLVDFGTRLLDRLETYKNQVDRIPEAFRHVKTELPVLLDALRRTQSAIDHGVHDDTKSALIPAIEGCKAQITLLDDIIVKALPSPTDSRFRRSGKAIQSLLYDTKVETITSVIRGYVQTLIFHAATSVSGDPSDERRFAPSSTVPFRRDPSFVDRHVFAELESKSNRPGSRVAMVGLGGVGKSQLAVEYSYRFQHTSENAWVFWIHASSIARFLEGYRKIAERVKPPGWDKPDADLLLLVYNWLSDERSSRWLMFIDNADDMEVFTSSTTRGRGTEDDLTSKSTTVLLDLIPQSSNGSVVVTSRSRDVAFRLTGDYEDIIRVSPMDQKEAVTLLQNRLKISLDEGSADHADAVSLVEALDHMPLAISQAASYIRQRSPRATVAKYVQDLHKDDQTRDKLLKVDLGDTRRDGTASNSIIATWQISFEHIRKESSSATKLLSLMSLFHRQGIPESILKDYYSSDAGPSASFEDDLTSLLSFSLIATDIDGSHFQMHRLVQFSTIKWLEMHNELDHWKNTYSVLIDKNYPDTAKEHLSSDRALFPHAYAGLNSRPQSDRALRAWASLLYKAMADAYNEGYYQVALDMGNQSLEVKEELLGMNDPDTLCSVSRLATALRLAGKYEEALPMCRRAHQGREKALGAEDPLTLSSLNTVGLILSELGDYEEAEIMHRRALKVQESVLGLEDRSTLQAMNDLGVLLTRRGKFSEAEVMHRIALQKESQLYGEDHEWTLATLDNLGLALGKQGKLDEAVLMHQRALEGSKKRFGETHPETLICARNVAAVLTFMGKHEGAETLHRQVLNDSLKVLGEGHPFTLISYCNLGSVLHAQAKYEEAESAHLKALSKRREMLGIKHPHTLSSMHNLALTLKGMSKGSEATTLMERCFRLRKQTLGTVHPDTVKSRKVLSDWTGLYYEDTTPSSQQHDVVRPRRLFALALMGAIGSLLMLVLLSSYKYQASKL